MRKVTEKAAQALLHMQNMKSGNTEVQVWQLGASLRLHGHIIATHYKDGRLTLDDCGWQTATTKERLNGVIHTFGFPMSIAQHQGEWHVHHADTLVNTAWNGVMTLEVA